MATIRKHRNKWQSIVRVQGHPLISKVFVSKTDANRWANLTEVKLRREDTGIAKIKFPKFEDVARRYVEERSINKKCYEKTCKGSRYKKRRHEETTFFKYIIFTILLNFNLNSRFIDMQKIFGGR